MTTFFRPIVAIPIVLGLLLGGGYRALLDDRYPSTDEQQSVRFEIP